MWLLAFLSSLLFGSPDLATLRESKSLDKDHLSYLNDYPLQQTSQVNPQRDDSFWDLKSFNTQEREALLKKALEITELEGYIDWELQRDNYLTSLFDIPAATSQNQAVKVDHSQIDLPSVDKSGYDADIGDVVDVSPRSKLSLVRRRLGEVRHKSGVVVKLGNEKTVKRRRKRHKLHGKGGQPNGKQKPDSLKAGSPNATIAGIVNKTASIKGQSRASGSNKTSNGGGDSILIPVYNYSLGNCPNNGAFGVPCAPSNLRDICNRFSPQGSFRKCLTTCMPSFCCIYDIPGTANTFAPNCNKDVNCPQWAWCYIAWWKLADHIGPATKLRVEPITSFYDIPAQEITPLLESNPTFYRTFLFHFFRNSSAVIKLGTVQTSPNTSDFNIDRIMLNSTYWNTSSQPV